MVKRAIGIGCLLVLGGCAWPGATDPGSPYYAYTPGWTVELARPLSIPADAATVRLQYGRIVPRNSVQEHDPFCIVELETVRAEPQTLQPGRFEVWRMTRSVNPIAAAAKPSLIKVGHVDDDGDPSFLYFITEFRLRDPNQPNLRGLRCAWNQMAPANRMLMRHLTLAEIHAALGDWMRLVPPQGSI